MKTIEVKLYSIEELSQKTQEKAHRKSLENFSYFWSSEDGDTVKKFCEVFNLNLKEHGYGYRGEGVNFSTNLDHEEETENLTGIRLLKYLHNNFGNDIFTPKYYKHLATKEECPKYHPRVKVTEIKTGPNKGKFYGAYYSAISKTTDCPLTGYYMDNYILSPIYKFLEAPNKNVTYLELLEECMNEWVKGGNEGLEDAMSFERFKEDCQANDWYFEEDGTMNNN